LPSSLIGHAAFDGAGTYSKKPEPGRQVTLIKSEVLESLKDKFEITVKPEESRRNILTQGIEINDLIGTNHPAMSLSGEASGSTGFIQGALGQRRHQLRNIK